jgi:hypothetical protein
LEIDELERYAAACEPLENLPKSLNVMEIAAFLAMRALYREFRFGAVPREQARIEKGRIIQSYDRGMILYRAMLQDADIRNRTSALRSEMVKSDCPLCKKAAAIWDGREKGE